MSEQENYTQLAPAVIQGENEVNELVQISEEQPRITFSDGKQTADIASDTVPENDTKIIKKIKEKSKDRKVSFPDVTVVSGYADPPNPWHGVSGLSTDSLISAYKHHCEKLNIKPLQRLLSQLQVIQDFDARQETLFLKGERLDARHVEAIEEIFRRVQFRTVDMEATNLDDESANALFEMIEYYDSAGRLNIAFNKSIGPRGWMSCSRLIKKAPSLEYLDVRNCTISDQGMGILGRSLRLGSTLSILHMENVGLAGRPLLILVAALKLNELLRELFLADNRLMPSDAIQLGNLLKFNHRLKLLDIRNNHIQDVGLTHLSDGLYEQSLDNGLHTLVLWNNQLTFQGMQSLSRALSSTKCLQTLNLGHNNISNEGILRLKEGLLQNRSLLRIGLQAAKISCEGAIALAEFVADSPELLRMDLRENDIKTAGLMALSLSLKHNTTVNRIDLDKEPKKENGVKDYAEQQERLIQDINSYLQRNRELAQKRAEEQSAAYEAQNAKAATEDGASDEKSLPENATEATEEQVPVAKGVTSEAEAPPADSCHPKHHPDSLKFVEQDQVRPQESLDSPAFAPDGAVTFSVNSDKVQFMKNVGNVIKEDEEEGHEAQCDDKDIEKDVDQECQEQGADNDNEADKMEVSSQTSVLSPLTSEEQISGGDSDSTLPLSQDAKLTEAPVKPLNTAPIPCVPPPSSLTPLMVQTIPLGASPPSFDLPRQTSPAASPTRAKRVFRINRVTETSPCPSPASSPVATHPAGGSFDAILSSQEHMGTVEKTQTEVHENTGPSLVTHSSETEKETNDKTPNEAASVEETPVVTGTNLEAGDSIKVTDETTVQLQHTGEKDNAGVSESTVDSRAHIQHCGVTGDKSDNGEEPVLLNTGDGSLQAGPETDGQKAENYVVDILQGAVKTYQEKLCEDPEKTESAAIESHIADHSVQCPSDDSANVDVDSSTSDVLVVGNKTKENKLETTQCDSAQDNSLLTSCTKTCDTANVQTTMSAGGEDVAENTTPPDLWDVDEGENEEKPDFHSSLTMNGMTRELAKVLDSLEETPQEPSTPNDLREMVAAALSEQTTENETTEEVPQEDTSENT
ncbi:uncharacterized protein LOC106151011 [Lingula anatina]|uniref:Uncharacterized protein LOC106151011 n=1 Tax=Lingula anatina TaxID=7574 RepID=A0A1S3H074_LINAN|nr:uncharacterized protein LOC106151011 [Lingula anatina]|eukprot:XP_013379525.1 uncharacterized protein LOC106151011 [Lingula anatina]